jgi:hypothetical protein
MFKFLNLKKRFPQALPYRPDKFESKIPLTERNIGTFNSEGKEESEEESKHDARNKLQQARQVQISEWLRLVS